jgi:dipeptidyl aminopeptidase/acylaminoacyl peptidase
MSAVCAIASASPPEPVTIPEVAAGVARGATVDDMSALRRIDSLRLSPDRRSFAILVRQADAAANDYRLGWFVGKVQGGPLLAVGQGGDVRLKVGPTQAYGGFEQPVARWSPDGRWIAYTALHDGAIQLWRSKADGSAREQLTHSAADVREFEWNAAGTALYFNVGTAREELRARELAKQRNGYHYDTDFRGFTDLMGLRAPPADKASTAWVVTIGASNERAATDAERNEFKDLQTASGGGFRPTAAGAFAERADGAQVVAKLNASRLMSRLEFVPAPAAQSKSIQCAAEECSGFIDRIWWADRNTVLFLRREGLGFAATGLYSWRPASGRVSAVMRTLDDLLQSCELGASMQLICARETPSGPPHVAAVDGKSGKVRVIGDVNPEFRNIALGKVERIEWSTPEFPWSVPGGRLHGMFPERTYGYILYPPDFQPTRKYPLFIAPYAAPGFDNIANREYALHAMAARGFVVLNANFPSATPEGQARFGRDHMKLGFSAELGFPFLSMYMESTVRALDLVIARGFVDERRVGIGGVSHGASTPMFLLMKHDRIAAAAISGGIWSQLEYYWGTPYAASVGFGESWFVKPVGEGLEFWKQIDLADDVESIEAPLLINTPATETYSLIRLMKHMREAGKPYDAYVFPQETHIKWQAAHIRACMERNLDWFSFWLQSYEDPDPAKADEYARWRGLRSPAATKARPSDTP